MTTLIEGKHPGGFLVWEAFRDYTRVNGGVKSDHWAAQKSATLDLGVTRATMRRPGSSALHIAGGCLAALARQNQCGEDCIRRVWWT